MAEATSLTFTQLQGYAGMQEALVTAVSTATETITLDGTINGEVVTTIKHVDAHVAATGVAVVYSFATNVLTRTTAGTDVADVIRVLYV